MRQHRCQGNFLCLPRAPAASHAERKAKKKTSDAFAPWISCAIEPLSAARPDSYGLRPRHSCWTNGAGRCLSVPWWVARRSTCNRLRLPSKACRPHPDLGSRPTYTCSLHVRSRQQVHASTRHPACWTIRMLLRRPSVSTAKRLCEARRAAVCTRVDTRHMRFCQQLVRRRQDALAHRPLAA